MSTVLADGNFKTSPCLGCISLSPFFSFLILYNLVGRKIETASRGKKIIKTSIINTAKSLRSGSGDNLNTRNKIYFPCFINSVFAVCHTVISDQRQVNNTTSAVAGSLYSAMQFVRMLNIGETLVTKTV
jgi:hypothetical protein